MNISDAITDLKEIRSEISQVNRNAGETIFNPALTGALEEVISWMKDNETAEDGTPNNAI